MNEQQKIGQQIMAVRMIKEENRKDYKDGVSVLRIESLAKAMEVTDEEVKELICCIEMLERFRIIEKVIHMYLAELDAENVMFYMGFIRIYGDLYRYHKEELNVTSIYMQEIKLREVFKIKADDREFHVAKIEKGLKAYIQYYQEAVEVVRQKGYNEIVIKEMLGNTFLWEALMKDKNG